MTFSGLVECFGSFWRTNDLNILRREGKNLRMKIEKYKEIAIKFGISLSMLLIFWGGMLRKSFNADTLGHMFSRDADIAWRIADGRYVIALVDTTLLKLGIRTTDNLSVFMLFTFLIFAMAMVVVQKIFVPWQPEEQWERIGYFCSVNLVFLNTLFAEILMFSEMSVYFALGYLLAAVGVDKFVQKKYTSMILLFAAAVCTYQFTMIFAAILIAFHICLKYREELNFKAVIEEIVGIIACMGLGILNYLSIRLLKIFGIIDHANKSVGWEINTQKMTVLKKSLISLFKNGHEIFPNLWIPLLFVLILFLIITYSCVKDRTVKKIPFIVIVFWGSMALIYSLPMIQSELYFPPRMAFCFYLIQGMLAVTAYALSRKEVRRLLTFVCVGYLMVQLLFSDFIVTNHFVSNTLDEVYANMMYQEVLKYEEETGNMVTKMAIYKDDYAPDRYEEISFHTDQINEKVLGIVSKSLVWKVTGREFDKIDPLDDIYEKYFKGKDWDYFDLSEQLVIIDDTAHWCIF